MRCLRVTSARPRTTAAGTAVETADFTLVVARRLDLAGQPAEGLVLTGTWDGQKDPVQLAAITNT